MTASTKLAVTLYGESWEAGYQAALDGQPQFQPPPGIQDKLAYYSGCIEGVTDRRRHYCHNPRRPEPRP